MVRRSKTVYNTDQATTENFLETSARVAISWRGRNDIMASITSTGSSGTTASMVSAKELISASSASQSIVLPASDAPGDSEPAGLNTSPTTIDCSVAGEGGMPSELDLGPKPLGLRMSSKESGEEDRLSTYSRPTAIWPIPRGLLACCFFLENLLETRRISPGLGLPLMWRLLLGKKASPAKAVPSSVSTSV
jgi:hypothetical protein